MTTLRIYSDQAQPQLLEEPQDCPAIAEHMQAIGVLFRRWPVVRGVGPHTDTEQVLQAYAEQTAALRDEFGLSSMDVISLHPAHAAAAAARQKFLQEHTHDDFEMRYFAAGGGLFYLRKAGKVYVLLCTAGDLISVPAGMTHWFDMSEAPYFVALRFFTREDGWVANFTGDEVANRYAPMTPLPEAGA